MRLLCIVSFWNPPILGFLHGVHGYISGFGLELPKVHLDSTKGWRNKWY